MKVSIGTRFEEEISLKTGWNVPQRALEIVGMTAAFVVGVITRACFAEYVEVVRFRFRWKDEDDGILFDVIVVINAWGTRKEIESKGHRIPEYISDAARLSQIFMEAISELVFTDLRQLIKDKRTLISRVERGMHSISL